MTIHIVHFLRTVKFKNKRIYWSDQFDFHLDQILERGHHVESPKASVLSINAIRYAMYWCKGTMRIVRSYQLAEYFKQEKSYANDR